MSAHTNGSIYRRAGKLIPGAYMIHMDGTSRRNRSIKHSRKKDQLILSFTLAVSMVLVLLAVAVQPSRAAVGDLVFTIEAPSVQRSQVQCNALVEETFDNLPPDTVANPTVRSIGTYVPIDINTDIFAQAATGGAEVPNLPTNFISTFTSYQLNLAQPAGYFGFWWSAGDGNNRIVVNMADGSSQSFTTQTILDSGQLVGTPGTAGGHFGNPTADFSGQLPEEVFAYVNVFATNPNAKITSIVFEKPTGQSFFETDNHTVCPDILDPNTGSPVPQFGSITIVKEANPESEQSFTFLTSIGGPGSSFSLKDNGTDPNSITFSDLPPRPYNVDELGLTGWTFVAPVQCSGGSDIVIGGKNVTITLSGGEDVICTYTNEKNGTIVIDKVTTPPGGASVKFDFAETITPGGGTFALSGSDAPQEFLDVAPGHYTVTEDVPPGQWSLTSISCDDGNSSGIVATGEATINLDPGETVTCTFTNVNPSVPVTLSWFNAERNGESVDFRWQTATESGTAGFNLLAVTESGTVQLNETLIPSQAVDSVEPLEYSFSAVTEATSFLIQEVTISGATDELGPFDIGVEFGAYIDLDGDDEHQIWLPFVTFR